MDRNHNREKTKLTTAGLILDGVWPSDVESELIEMMPALR